MLFERAYRLSEQFEDIRQTHLPTPGDNVDYTVSAS